MAKHLRYWLFALLTLNIFLFGSDPKFLVGSLNLRKLLFLGFFISSMWVFLNRKKHWTYEYTEIISFLLFIVIFTFAVPTVRGTPISGSLSDALPLIAVGVFLISFDLPENLTRWRRLRYLVLLLVLIAIGIHIGLFLLSRLNVNAALAIGSMLGALLGNGAGDGQDFVYLSIGTANHLRIYLGSSFLLFLGLYLSTMHRSIGGSRITNFGWLLAGLTVIAVIATNTRAFYLGILAYALTFALARRCFPMLRLTTGTMMLLLCLPFFFSYMLLPLLSPDLLKLVGLARQGSDNVRADELMPMLSAWGSSPIVGLGFGANASYIRSELTPWAYELSTLGLLMKIGALGMFMGWLGLARNLSAGYHDRTHILPEGLVSLYALYCSFIVISTFNPYMFGFFGTFLMLFMLYEYKFILERARYD